MRLRPAALRRCFPRIFLIPALLVYITIRASALLAADQSDCARYYFGFSGAPDYSKALKCYEAEKNWEFLILMHLNGEGTQADVTRAAELFKEWEKSGPGQASDLQAEALRKAIEERSSNPGAAHPRLDYCTDIAGDTPTLNFCGRISEQISENRFRKTVAGTRAKLSAADADALDGVTESFVAFMEAESGRMYRQYIDGTIRNQAAYAQKTLVRDNFLKLVEETVDQRGLKSSSVQNYKAADKALNDVYTESLRDYAKTYEDLLKNENSKESRETYTGYIKDFRAQSKQAQICWIKYRDLFAELAAALYADQRNKFDPALSLKTELTKIRVGELKNDPEGER